MNILIILPLLLASTILFIFGGIVFGIILIKEFDEYKSRITHRKILNEDKCHCGRRVKRDLNGDWCCPDSTVTIDFTN